ncbi:hypothetical protein [Nonomuraea dietziae]|uniref:hypothetical protein n=1 Tax=Nonomuraea dietziae TaxID=65515 RepID=UPI0031E47EDA
MRAAAEEAAMSVGAAWRPVQEVLRDCLPEDTIVAGDSAQVSYFGTVPFWPMDAPRRFVYPTGYATLGYAVARRDRRQAGGPGQDRDRAGR